MEKPSTAHHARRTYCETNVTQYNASGMNKAAYCRKHNLVYHQFVWWQRKLRTDADDDTSEFVALAGSLKALGNDYPVVIGQYGDILLAFAKYNKV